MIIFKKTKDFLSGLWGVISATTGSPGTPVQDKPIQTKLFVPIPEWNKLVIQKLALAKQLKAARHALSVIENMTYERTRLLTGEIERIHKLAHEDCREATK